MSKALLLALLLVGSTSVPAMAEPYPIDTDNIVRVGCFSFLSSSSGSAVKIGEDKYITAAHVINNGTCSVGDTMIRDVVFDDEHDFATFTGPSGPNKAKITCSGFRRDEMYLAIGYAFGYMHQTYQPWLASPLDLGGFRAFIGESIPGMSGGAVTDERGRVVGVVNMRWPARSMALRNTSVCKDK